jgi:hypothetical protein
MVSREPINPLSSQNWDGGWKPSKIPTPWNFHGLPTTTKILLFIVYIHVGLPCQVLFSSDRIKSLPAVSQMHHWHCPIIKRACNILHPWP